MVRLVDGSGHGVAGQPVTWVVGIGEGASDPHSSETDAGGVASTHWTLGPGPGPNTLNAVVSGVGVVSFTATAVADGEDGALLLKHESVPISVKLTVSSTIDSPVPEAALVRASGASLASFKKVDSRQEGKPKPNLAGAQIVSIWRKGTGEAGSVQSVEAYGLTASNYWLLTLLHQGTLDAKAEAALKELIQGASVEMVQ